LRLWQSLGHTLIFTAVALPVELALGLLLAHLFLEKMPGRAIFIALLTLPTMISPIVSGATWRLLFDHHFGPINQIIAWIAGHQVPIIWIVNPNTVYPAILICEIWQWTPFMFLILLAALSNVDKSLLEAAELDGAPYVTVFRRIVLPAIWPVMSVALMIRGLDLMRLFDIVWALTRGGPGTMTETVSIYTYLQGFEQFEVSYTAAIAFLMIILLTVAVMWLLKRMEIAR
jgi:multiple sugar transport system permease protein